MPNEQVAIAKKINSSVVEYTCPRCGWYDRTGVFREFLPFIDHLIQDLCLMHSRDFVGEPIILPDGRVWFQNVSRNKLILGLPNYSPESPEWNALLVKGQKMLPQAKLFLADIADWLEMALISIDEELNFLAKSDVLTAEVLIARIGNLSHSYQDQQSYLQNYEEAIVGIGTDPKWTGKKGKQARFVARSFAGARWGLASSSSREMIRIIKPSEKKKAFEELRIPFRGFWWLPEE